MGRKFKADHPWVLSKLRTHPGEICLLAYLDHELSSAAHATVKKHFKDCAACREALASLKMTSRMFEELIRKSNQKDSRVEIGELRQLVLSENMLKVAQPLTSGQANEFSRKVEVTWCR